jgi:hypothetical protein
MTMADFSDISANRFQEDLRRAAGYKPLIKEDLTKAYKRYESAGVKFGRVGSKSDKDLYKMATNDVLTWYKKNKAQAAKPSPTSPSSVAPSTVTRSQAANLIRQMGLDPAEVIGWGKPKVSGWINTDAAKYVWRSQQSFVDWVTRTYSGK